MLSLHSALVSGSKAQQLALDWWPWDHLTACGTWRWEGRELAGGQPGLTDGADLAAVGTAGVPGPRVSLAGR